ncbi:MAG: hypothetical protein Q7Q71_05105 [Verrucomicrobiota bacterium JB023]|nr:hypothetical protein [Verrucomicrobiota bacterium JB023]
MKISKPRLPQSLAYLCIQTLIFGLLVGSNVRGATIEEADFENIPQGETITLTGTGFTGTSSAMFFASGRSVEATFNEISDEELKVDFAVAGPGSYYHLLVEAAEGSTVTFDGDVASITDFEEVGTFSGFFLSSDHLLRVKPGAVVEALQAPGLSAIYVEAGGAFSDFSGLGTAMLFAEDGAILDFRGFSGTAGLHTRVFYSPNTQILGEIPTNTGPVPPFNQGNPFAREVSPLSLSLGVGPFTRGYELIVNTVGDGQVERSLPGPYYGRSEVIELTAIAAEGQYFQGWTGAVQSTEATISVRGSSGPVTATFVGGRVLQVYEAWGGEVVREPDLDVYAEGATVALTANSQEGFEFVGWGGDLVGTESVMDVVMNGDKRVVPLFQPIVSSVLPEVTGVESPYVPEGESFVFTGSGFTGMSRASFLGPSAVMEAPFNATSDTSLEVTYQASRPQAEHHLLLEAEAGSVIVTGDRAGEAEVFDSVGDYLPVVFRGGEVLIVKAGAILEGVTSLNLGLIYVEAGGVLSWQSANLFRGYIFAEDGAVLDFRQGFPGSFTQTASVYHSPGTVVLGEIPSIQAPPLGDVDSSLAAKEVSSLSLSFGLGPFTQGSELEVEVIGDGSVERDKPGPYYASGEQVTLTATPGDGQYFTGWSGGSTSDDATITVSLPVAPLTATFSSGRQLELITGLGGVVVRSPELDAYPDQSVVTLTAQAADGFEFVAWGGEASGKEESVDLLMDADKLVIPIFRSTEQESLPRIESADATAVPLGETITLTGYGFTNTTKASFLWSRAEEDLAFTEVSDSSLEISYEGKLSLQDHDLMVETAQGTTVTSGYSVEEASVFEGIGPLQGLGGQGEVLIVKAGSLLEASGWLNFRVIYVEAGAVLRWSAAGSFFGKVFAEDGATLDFRQGFPSSGALTASVYYSPETLVLGELPEASGPPLGPPFGPANPIPVARQVTPITMSYGVGPFSAAYPVEVIVEGPGQVTGLEAIGDYVQRGEVISLTAVADEGKHFVRWSGSSSSSDPDLTLTVRGPVKLIAKFSSRVDFLTEWRQRYFSATDLADVDISGLDANPDGDKLTNTAEYAFGSNPLVADDNSQFTITAVDPTSQTIEISYQRPQFSADLDYFYLGAAGMTEWVDLRDEEDILVEEFATEQIDETLERVSVRFTFTTEFPSQFGFQIAAEVR